MNERPSLRPGRASPDAFRERVHAGTGTKGQESVNPHSLRWSALIEDH